MKEMLERVISYLRGMWHRRWVGLAAAWIAAIIGVGIVYKVPEKYTGYPAAQAASVKNAAQVVMDEIK